MLRATKYIINPIIMQTKLSNMFILYSFICKCLCFAYLVQIMFCGVYWIIIDKINLILQNRSHRHNLATFRIADNYLWPFSSTILYRKRSKCQLWYKVFHILCSFHFPYINFIFKSGINFFLFIIVLSRLHINYIFQLLLRVLQNSPQKIKQKPQLSQAEAFLYP